MTMPMTVVIYGETEAPRALLIAAARALGADVTIALSTTLDVLRLLDVQPPPTLLLVAEDTGEGMSVAEDDPTRLLHDHVLRAARDRGIPAVLLGRWTRTGPVGGAPVVYDWGAGQRASVILEVARVAREQMAAWPVGPQRMAV